LKIPVANTHPSITEVKVGADTKLIAMMAIGKPQAFNSNSVMGYRLFCDSDKKFTKPQRGNYL
jgi:hypothetical protein